MRRTIQICSGKHFMALQLHVTVAYFGNDHFGSKAMVTNTATKVKLLDDAVSLLIKSAAKLKIIADVGKYQLSPRSE